MYLLNGAYLPSKKLGDFRVDDLSCAWSFKNCDAILLFNPFR